MFGGGEKRGHSEFFKDKRHNVSLDIFRSKTKPLKTRQPFRSDVPAQEIVEDLEAALDQFRKIATYLGGEGVSPQET
jgi:hypothetical protein